MFFFEKGTIPLKQDPVSNAEQKIYDLSQVSYETFMFGAINRVKSILKGKIEDTDKYEPLYPFYKDF